MWSTCQEVQCSSPSLPSSVARTAAKATAAHRRVVPQTFRGEAATAPFPVALMLKGPPVQSPDDATDTLVKWCSSRH